MAAVPKGSFGGGSKNNPMTPLRHLQPGDVSFTPTPYTNLSVDKSPFKWHLVCVFSAVLRP